MSLDMVVKRLNKSFSSIRDEESFYNFYCGDVENNILDICSRVCPYGKVLLLCSEESDFNSDYINLLNKNGFKPCLEKIEKEDCNKIEKVSKLFSLEDVRLVISLDCYVNAVAQYFSTINKIDCVILVKERNICSVVNKYIYFIDLYDNHFFDIKCNNHIVFDEYSLKNNDVSAKMYAYILSKIVSLFDYRIYCVAKDKSLNKGAYELLKNTIIDTYKIMDYNSEIRLYKLIENTFIVQLAHYHCWELQNNSSAKNCADFLTNGFNENIEEEFFCFTKIIKAYNLMFSGEYLDNLLVPDYNYIFLESEKLNNYKENFLCIKSSIDCYRKNKKQLFIIAKCMFSEITQINKNVDLIINTYIALGGKYVKYNNIKRAIYFGGNKTNCFNGLSLLKENGLLELLK